VTSIRSITINNSDRGLSRRQASAKDVDVAFLYDCFTITVFLAQGLGFVPKGGRSLALEGRMEIGKTSL
jgi:hypothetical protein